MTEQEFNGYYEKYRRMIYFYAIKKCGDAYLSEEVTAQSFIELWKYKSPFECERHVRTHMLMTVRNRLVNAYVKNSRMRKAYASAIIEESAYDINPAERDRLEQEILTKVFEIVEAMPEINKEIFMLTCIKKMQLREAAQITGLSRPTACRVRKEVFETVRKAFRRSNSSTQLIQ
jgi:RNA polymerase sigma factor (sigma-70 family)